MEEAQIIHNRISKLLSLSDKVCTARYIWKHASKSSCKSFESSMCCTATGLFFGFVGELLTFSRRPNKYSCQESFELHTYSAVQAVSQPNRSIADNKQTIYIRLSSRVFGKFVVSETLMHLSKELFYKIKL